MLLQSTVRQRKVVKNPPQPKIAATRAATRAATGGGNEGGLSGTWQASTCARFRIEDDGTKATIELITSDVLRKFSEL